MKNFVKGICCVFFAFGGIGVIGGAFEFLTSVGHSGNDAEEGLVILLSSLFGWLVSGVAWLIADAVPPKEEVRKVSWEEIEAGINQRAEAVKERKAQEAGR